jgi:glycyl-tRNA synthetase
MKLAAEVGGHVPELPALLDEVTDLVEWPVGILGSFDPAYLAIPPEVLTTVMKKHQRYFPVLGKNNDELLPHFIAIVNGRGRDLDLVREGNEDVLRARYADADYFVKQDRKERIEDFVPRLARLVFHEKLGSVLDKQTRVERLTEALAVVLNLSEQQHRWASRAAALCKADLASSMVVEITALQGFMGREYARASGEDEEVAQAIFEHYLPRSAGDALPASEVGVAIGLADRFDSLAGLFAAGLRPVGSADPFGVRRIALGLIQLLVERQVPLSLREWLAAAAAIQPIPSSDKDRTEAWTFLVDRLQGRLRDQGRPADVVAAVLAAQGDDPFRASLACVQLSEAVREPDWAEALTAYARCKRIVRPLNEVFAPAKELYVEPATRSLFDHLQEVSPRLAARPDVPTLVAVLRELRAPINTFFSEVMVMADDPAIKRARLGLVQAIAALPDRIADLSRLNGY